MAKKKIKICNICGETECGCNARKRKFSEEQISIWQKIRDAALKGIRRDRKFERLE